MGEWSKTVDATGFFGYNQTLNGQMSVEFEVTAIPVAGWILGKSTDVPDLSRQVFYLTEIWLSCGTSTVRIFDGSTGDAIVGLSCASSGATSQHWDFRHNPLLCLTADSTTYLCVSSNGINASGHINGYWGAKPQ